MPEIKVRGQTLDIDIETELREFDWTRARWTADKLQAASPMRYDQTPSFFVNLDGEYAGTWSDSAHMTPNGRPVILRNYSLSCGRKRMKKPRTIYSKRTAFLRTASVGNSDCLR